LPPRLQKKKEKKKKLKKGQKGRKKERASTNQGTGTWGGGKRGTARLFDRGKGDKK